ncbi:phytanoyl-CoA dioxygenase family protein [Pseudomarimonas salicorniae]|uniref:Phytanoyl-CoA dioxygenase family protein n=1 Tax=Pseudomarimonas salicorniae TaxID=2933270 RepID=A0ABT0GGJ5_9GAMM|nr:phytanoyl-CoA dioxygenase family protein [Lysobacter sp. CAU 1642]MCK7593662.1 phytanoyl-CoA dioxygenase family protein [Lysobacter sp. CAU 1642]
MLRALAAGLSARAAARRLRRDGAVILRGLLDPDEVDALREAIDRAWVDDSLGAIASLPPDATNVPARADLRSLPGVRLLDPHWSLPPVRRALLHPRIVGCLSAVYGTAPLLFQSQSFEDSPRAVRHRDDAYLALSPNRSLMAVWLALEPVGPGQGELEYVPGSHRIPAYAFGEGRTWFTPPLDDGTAHQRYVDFLSLECHQRGLSARRFHARPGDAIIWDGALVHGSAPMVGAVRSRRSLVAHYCAANVSPRYLQEGAGRLAPAAEQRARFSTGFYPAEQISPPG